MVASGFAGLGYQIVWTQQCALWLGHESAAVLAVVAAFFGGLAVGAFALGARITRSARPVRWYAGCELTIALWSLLLIVAMPPFSAGVLRVTGVQPAPAWQWFAAFAGTFVLLLPATAAMGATLPAMERMIAQAPASSEPHSIAGLYASNTFGAVVGVLAAAFWLVPAIGLARTAAISIALNVLCGVAALVLFPLWWIVGLGSFVFPIFAIPMALQLMRKPYIRTPPWFFLWGMFVAWSLLGGIMLNLTAPDTLPQTYAQGIDGYILRSLQYL
jgi:spermidine synthase